jgi:hypothetical protein
LLWLVLPTTASCQQERGSKSAVTFPHLLHEAENILPSGKSALRIFRKSFFISCPWFLYITLKISYKFEANISKKLYSLYVKIMEMLGLVLLVSGAGKWLDHSRSQPSHIHNRTSVPVQLKHSYQLSAVIFLLCAETKVLFAFGCLWGLKVAPFCSQLTKRTEFKRKVPQMSRGLKVSE